MDILLQKVTSQATNYAIRSGLGLVAGYAIRESSKLLNNAPKGSVRDELYTLQQRLQHKIRIISPAIDMIDLIAARGNTSLETALNLTKELRQDIHSIGQRLAHANAVFEKLNRSTKTNKQLQAEHDMDLKVIVFEIKDLLGRIEDAIPLISLAITTSGVTLSTSLPHTVSPSRLLQASTLLTAGDTQYTLKPHQATQVGPTFVLTIYMLFAGHDRPQTEEDMRETTWKEVIHKAKVKLRRVPLDMVSQTGSGSEAMPSAQIKSTSTEPSQTDIPAESRSEEFAYQLMIVEDFEDDRMHDFEDDQPQPGPFDDVTLAGIREMIPIHEVSKIFYADTSKVLNIGTDSESNHPVLLLKRDVNAVLPRALADRANPTRQGEPSSQDEKQCVAEDHVDRNQDPWRLPPSLDPEWIAFEVYTEPSDDSDTEDLDTSTNGLKPSPSLEKSLANLDISSSSPSTSPNKPSSTNTQLATVTPPPWISAIPTSLSLLELLLRLTSLQQFEQASHLAITDEMLNFFLEESATTGAGGDEKQRQRVRGEARRRVGWDVYDESPVKRRGESYQYGDDNGYGGGYGNGYENSPGLGRHMSPRMYNQTYANGGGGWSPSPAPPQTQSQLQARSRSMTKLSDGQSYNQNNDQDQGQMPSPSPSPAPMQKGTSRPEWLKRAGTSERKGSPLRPSTAITDEGLGTSPPTLSINNTRNSNGNTTYSEVVLPSIEKDNVSGGAEDVGNGAAADGSVNDELRRLEEEFTQRKAWLLRKA